MAKIVKQGYLNNFVTPVSEGGWGLCTTIISYMAENRSYTDNEIYLAISADTGLTASVKALSFQEIEQIMDWMVGKTFKINDTDITIVQTDNITYTPTGETISG